MPRELSISESASEAVRASVRPVSLEGSGKGLRSAAPGEQWQSRASGRSGPPAWRIASRIHPLTIHAGRHGEPGAEAQVNEPHGRPAGTRTKTTRCEPTRSTDCHSTWSRPSLRRRDPGDAATLSACSPGSTLAGNGRELLGRAQPLCAAANARGCTRAGRDQTRSSRTARASALGCRAFNTARPRV